MITSPVANRTSGVNLGDVLDQVRKHYGDEIAMANKAGLALVGSHSLMQREHCLSLIYVGAAGKGKSISVDLLKSDRTTTENYLYRVDNFTPASFVSHAANKNPAQLAKIDLLPKVKDKTMLTKELSPLFRGDIKDMTKNFSTLTAILDGKGYLTQSGAQGKRGYNGEHLFNWIGATTPFGDQLYKLMGQLGNRMYFYEIVPVDLQVEDLIEYAMQDNTESNFKECNKLVNDFVEGHFARYPLKTIDQSSILKPINAIEQLVHYAEFISHGRAEVTADQFGGYQRVEPEGPHRIINSLKYLTMGSALCDERFNISAVDDLPMIRHVAFSSIPDRRRKLLRAVLLRGGSMTSADAERSLDVSRPTALEWFKELAATKIVSLQPGDQKASAPAVITLAAKWNWLLDGQSATSAPKPTGTDPL